MPTRCAAHAPRPLATAPTSWRFRSCSSAGYPPEDLVLKPAFQAACRAKVEELARETADGGPGGARRHALGRGRQALQRLLPARPRRDRRGALQGRPAELRRVRREARVCSGAAAGPGQLSRRAPRHSDLRGHLATHARVVETLGGDRRGTSGGAERLALLARQGRRPPQRRGRARHRERPADRLHQPGRRPGRTRLRRRLVRAACRPLARLPASGLPRTDDDAALGALRQWLALRRRTDREARRQRRPGRLHRLHAGAARLRREERLQGRGARPLGRHRFRAGGGARRRCARARARALRDAALSLHLAGIDRRRGAGRQGARRAIRHRADRERGAGAWRRRSRRSSPAGRAT